MRPEFRSCRFSVEWFRPIPATPALAEPDHSDVVELSRRVNCLGIDRMQDSNTSRLSSLAINPLVVIISGNRQIFLGQTDDKNRYGTFFVLA
jgi:hypothetical protein